MGGGRGGLPSTQRTHDTKAGGRGPLPDTLTIGVTEAEERGPLPGTWRMTATAAALRGVVGRSAQRGPQGTSSNAYETQSNV